MQLYHTFISYARPDAEFALRLANDLRGAGVNVWLDQLDIPPGARWDRAVETALETCGRLLVILSPTSADSENVQDEIGLAFDNKKPIVPILCSACEVPMRLRRLQYIDFTSDYDHGLQTLLTVLKLPVTAPEGSGAAEMQRPGSETAAPASHATRAASAVPVAAKPAGASNRNRVIAIAVAVAALLFVVVRLNRGHSASDSAVDANAQPTAEGPGDTSGSESAFVTMATVKVVNGTSWTIKEMYMRASGETDWGRELLGDNVVIDAEGGEHTVRQIPCGDYDVRLVDEDGDECVIEGQNLCDEGLTWEFTSEDLLACQSDTGAGADSPD